VGAPRFSFSEDGESRQSVVGYELRDSIKAYEDDTYTVYLDTELDGFNTTDNGRRLSAVSKAYVRIEAKEERPFREMNEVIGRIQRFITLGVGEPTPPTIIFGFTDQAPDEPVLFYGQPIDHEIQEKSVHPFQFLFDYSSVRGRIQEIIGTWFRCEDVIRPALNLYFGNLYNRNLYLDNRFLLLAQAIEVFHRRTDNHTELSEEEFKARLTAIGAAVPEYEKWVKGKLSFGNELSLITRVNDLLGKHATRIERFIPEPEKFAKKLRDTRNYMTHYTKTLEKKAAKGEALYGVTPVWWTVKDYATRSRIVHLLSYAAGDR